MIGETRPLPDASAPDGDGLAESREAVSGRRPLQAAPREIGGRDGPEPTRYGDWEKNGRCIDF
jgi:hypothetical protein